MSRGVSKDILLKSKNKRFQNGGCCQVNEKAQSVKIFEKYVTTRILLNKSVGKKPK